MKRDTATDPNPARTATGDNRTVSLEERNRMIEDYLPLVRKIARSVIGNHSYQLDYEDLVTAGVFGLIQAMEHYDPGYGVSFAGYCQLRVRGAMYDELQKLDWVPRHIRRQQKDIAQARQELENHLRRPARPSEIAAAIDLPPETFRSRQRKTATGKMISLSRFVGEDRSDGDLVDPNSPRPDDCMEAEHALDDFTKGLTKMEQMILTLYYKEELNMQQIGLLGGVSESRICQIHSRILDRLKSKFADGQPCPAGR